MQQQRNVRVTIFRGCRSGSPHLKPVINAQDPVAIGVFDHGHGRRYAFAMFHDVAAGTNPDDLKVGWKRERQHHRRHQKSPTPASDPGQQH